MDQSFDSYVTNVDPVFDADPRLEGILNECLEEIQLCHATVADCLAKYPEAAQALEPLLEMAIALQEIPDLRPSPRYRQTLRRKLLELPPPPPWDRLAAQVLGYLRSRIAVLAGFVFALVAFSAGACVTYSASQILPDSPFYSIKRQMERIQLALTTDEDSQTHLHMELAARRLAEIEALANAGELELAEQTAADYGNEVHLAYRGLRLKPGDEWPAMAKFVREDLMRQQAELQTQEQSAPQLSRPALQAALAITQNVVQQMDAPAPLSSQ